MKYIQQLRTPILSGSHVKHQPGKPILEVNALSVRYDSLVALEDITFQVSTGERMAVIGPNGAGKSTLFKVIAGVLTPSSGEVTVSGTVPGQHICIGYLPQRSHVDWQFPVNVTDVVMMGRVSRLGPLRWPQSQDRELVRRSLELVGLSGLAKRQISELSGGQQQRMFIARALAQEAELMLMDEPFAGLDLSSQQDILTILDELRGSGVTVLASTHDMDLVESAFERVLLLNRRQIGIGQPSEVFTREHLLSAFGGHLRLVPDGESLVALGDTCCDEGEEIHDRLA